MQSKNAINHEKADSLILELVRRNGGQMPMMKLLKLLYYVDFISMARLERTVTGGVYCAWEMGPVCLPVYHDIPKGDFKSVRIQENESATLVVPRNGDSTPEPLSKEEAAIVDYVWQRYGRYTGGYLSELTHQEIPWRSARENSEDLLDYDLADMEFGGIDLSEPIEEDEESLAALRELNAALSESPATIL